MTDETKLADPRDFLPHQPFVNELGMEIVSCEPGEVVVEMPFDKRFSTPPASFPASIVGALGDVAAVSSCLSKLPAGWATATLDFTIKMTGPASGKSLVARGRTLQSGKTTSVGTADVFCSTDNGEVHCATVLATTRNFQIKPATRQQD